MEKAAWKKLLSLKPEKAYKRSVLMERMAIAERNFAKALAKAKVEAGKVGMEYICRDGIIILSKVD